MVRSIWCSKRITILFNFSENILRIVLSFTMHPLKVIMNFQKSLTSTVDNCFRLNFLRKSHSSICYKVDFSLGLPLFIVFQYIASEKV